MFVKICGITSEEDALLAIAMGADALGFIFAAGSPRLVAHGRVADIVRRLPPEIVTVGVFRDEVPERLVRIVERCGLVGAQIHGHATPDQVAYINQRVAFTVRAFGAGDPSIRTARQLQVSALHIDNHTPGSGQSFDWELTREVPTGVRFVLAGGLHAGNVANAVARVRPWGVDASTGVEAEPGRKDPRKLRAFIAAARAALDEVAADWDDWEMPRAGTGPLYDWEDEEA